MQRVTLSKMEYYDVLNCFECKSKWARVFSEFMAENVPIQELRYSPEEYKSADSMRNTSRQALNRLKARGKSLPICITVRQNRVFLIRTDM